LISLLNSELAAILIDLLKLWVLICFGWRLLVVTEQSCNILAVIVWITLNEQSKVADLGWIIILTVHLESTLKVESAIFSSIICQISSFIFLLLLWINIELFTIKPAIETSLEGQSVLLLGDIIKIKVHQILVVIVQLDTSHPVDTMTLGRVFIIPFCVD
jgi:hypothetical protein